MLIGAMVGGIIGALYAFSLPNQYTSQITVLPEYQSKGPSSLGGLGSLAGLAGIDIGGMSGGADAIRPELYPNVLQSTPFALSLLKENVYSAGTNKPTRFDTYLEGQNKLGLFGWLSTSQEDPETPSPGPMVEQRGIRLTKRQEGMAKIIQNKITAAYEKKTGMITLVATMPDPFVAAQIATLSLTYLTDYITTYRTEKARRELSFLTKQTDAAKQRYQNSEISLSTYRDRNRNLYLNTAKIEEQRIQADFILAQDVYNNLSKQVEMAKIKVQEQVPVLKILEPAKVPTRKSSPSRVLVILSFIGFSLVMILIYRIIKHFAN